MMQETNKFNDNNQNENENENEIDNDNDNDTRNHHNHQSSSKIPSKSFLVLLFIGLALALFLDPNIHSNVKIRSGLIYSKIFNVKSYKDDIKTEIQRIEELQKQVIELNEKLQNIRGIITNDVNRFDFQKIEDAKKITKTINDRQSALETHVNYLIKYAEDLSRNCSSEVEHRDNIKIQVFNATNNLNSQVNTLYQSLSSIENSAKENIASLLSLAKSQKNRLDYLQEVIRQEIQESQKMECPTCDCPTFDCPTCDCPTCDCPTCELCMQDSSLCPSCPMQSCPEVEPAKCPEVEPPKCPEVEPPKCPEVEPPKCPEVEPAKCPEVEPPKCPEVEPLKCPEVEPLKCPEVEPLKCPEVEPLKCPSCPEVEAPNCPTNETPLCPTCPEIEATICPVYHQSECNSTLMDTSSCPKCDSSPEFILTKYDLIDLYDISEDAANAILLGMSSSGNTISTKDVLNLLETLDVDLNQQIESHEITQFADLMAYDFLQGAEEDEEYVDRLIYEIANWISNANLAMNQSSNSKVLIHKLAQLYSDNPATCEPPKDCECEPQKVCEPPKDCEPPKSCEPQKECICPTDSNINRMNSLPIVESQKRNLEDVQDLGMDYASVRNGAYILKSSETYLPKKGPNINFGGMVNGLLNKVGIKNDLISNKFSIPDPSYILQNLGFESGLGLPHDVLTGDMTPGSCWPMEGYKGYITIKLSSPISPVAIAINHLHKSDAKDISTAPKHFEVFMNLSNNQHIHFDGFYDITKKNTLQIFDFPNIEASDAVSNTITIVFNSNYGHNNYTCIYSISVFGREV